MSAAESAFESPQQLREVYREPNQRVLDKVIDHVDDASARFLAASPFFVLASSDGREVDASPRGGTPGFVRVLDQHHIAFGDLTGNNRLDSLSNVTTNPAVGIVAMIPGVLETLRINGHAIVSTDPDLCQRCEINGRQPRTVTLVRVKEVYVQCGAALKRAAIWDTDSWLADDQRPTGGEVLAAHIGGDHHEIDRDLAAYYDHAAWFVGGEDHQNAPQPRQPS